MAESESERDWTWGFIAAVALDLLLDGLLLGIGFAAGANEGVTLTLALTAETLSLGLATAATLRRSDQSSRRQVAGIMVALSCVFAVGSFLGATLLQGLSDHVLSGVLAFGCAALLYLVAEELLVEAHEVKETPFAAAMFFVGFLLFLILGMLE